MTTETNPAIRAVNLTRTFEVGETTIEALRGVSLEVPRGQFVALVGPSGSGKSTFLNLVGGLDRPTGGELWVDGVELSASKEKALTEHRRTRVGFVFQSFNLLPRLTAVENVALPLMFTGVPERERLARAQGPAGPASGWGSAWRTGPRSSPAASSSGWPSPGRWSAQPAIILADEPTGNVDSTTGAEIMALLRGLNRDQGVTLLAGDPRPRGGSLCRPRRPVARRADRAPDEEGAS